MRYLTTTIATIALIGLAGCAAFEGNTLGETKIETEFQGNSVERIKAAEPVIAKMAEAGFEPETTQRIMASLTRPLPSRMALTDGKDKAQIDWSVNVAEGTATYSASEVVATDPAQVKARIQEAAGDDAVQAIESAFPGGITGLIDALSQAGAL